jgi:hypothetical protein
MGLQARRLANVSIFVAICVYVSIILLRIVLSIAVNSD